MVGFTDKLIEEAVKECCLFSTYIVYRQNQKIIDYLRQYKYSALEVINSIFSIPNLCYTDGFQLLPEKHKDLHLRLLYHYTKFYFSSDITRIFFNSPKVANQTKEFLETYGVHSRIWGQNKLFLDWENKKKIIAIIHPNLNV